MAFGNAEEGGKSGRFLILDFGWEEEESDAWALEQSTPLGNSGGWSGEAAWLRSSHADVE
jgi:hypothetical protein